MTFEEMLMDGYTVDELMLETGESKETIQKKKALYEQEKSTKERIEKYRQNLPHTVREELAAYGVKKEQGSFTWEDYSKLPEDYRAEIIEGTLYKMWSPSIAHQLIGTEIFSVIREFIRKNKGSCIASAAPTDVQLFEDEITIVQPDILVVCDRNKVDRKRVYGAPDLVIEIVSPGTKRKDTGIKLEKYKAAGVKEYWLLDPDYKRLIVHEFFHDDKTTLYSFEDTVPIAIFDGKCRISFKDIQEYISFLDE